MATSRFYLTSQGSTSLTPAFDAGWEQTGQATRNRMTLKRKMESINTLANSSNITVPITTTQDILCAQFISDPIESPINLFGRVSLVVRGSQSVTTCNATLAVVFKVVDQQGGNQRTLFSVFSTDSAFAAAGSDATRIVNAQAITATITLPGDRLVMEIGVHVAAPSTSGTYLLRFGNSAASDFALTSALTTDLNPWFEMNNDIESEQTNNYQFVDVKDGMSCTEKRR